MDFENHDFPPPLKINLKKNITKILLIFYILVYKKNISSIITFILTP